MYFLHISWETFYLAILQLLSLITFNAQHFTVTAAVSFLTKSKAVLVAKYWKMWNTEI